MTAVWLECRVEAQVAEMDALCAEFLTTLREGHPHLDLQYGSEDVPRIVLWLTHADARGLGASLSWIAADGRQTEGTELRTAFFDRASDPTLRRRFFVALLQQNPLPF